RSKLTIVLLHGFCLLSYAFQPSFRVWRIGFMFSHPTTPDMAFGGASGPVILARHASAVRSKCAAGRATPSGSPPAPLTSTLEKSHDYHQPYVSPTAAALALLRLLRLRTRV